MNLAGMKKAVERVAEQSEAKKAEKDAATMKAYNQPASRSTTQAPVRSTVTSPQGPRRRVTAMDVKSMGFKKGGYVKAADGCAKKGKTRGKMV